jgi:hypothetical protein
VNKTLALVFVFAVLSSLMVLTVRPVTAQATFKPSVPEFTVKLVDNSYDVPPTTTTTTNPYTGEKTTTITPGYRVENKSIVITVKDQSFTPYKGTDGYTRVMRYTVEVKGHFSEYWQQWDGAFPSESQYNVLTGHARYIVGDQLDFRVEAIIGYFKQVDLWFSHFVTEVSSGWSNVQTFTMPGEFSSPLPSQTVVTQPTNPPATSGNNQQQTSEQIQQSKQSQLPNFMFGALVGILATIWVLLFGRWCLTRQQKTRNDSFVQ